MAAPLPSSAQRGGDLRLDGRTLLVAAAYVVLRRDTEVLLQLRQNTGYLDGHWACLAGHVDPGESAHDAAVREAREESGISISPDRLRPLTTLHRFIVDGPQVEQRCDFFFEAREWDGEPDVTEPTKTAEMRWFPIDPLPDPVVAHERMVLELLRRGSLPAVLSLPAGMP